MRQQTFTIPTELVIRLEERAASEHVTVEALVRRYAATHLPSFLASAAHDALRKSDRQELRDVPLEGGPPGARLYTPAEQAALEDRPEYDYLTPESMDERGRVAIVNEEERDTH